MFDTLLYSVIFVNTKLSRKEVIVMKRVFLLVFCCVLFVPVIASAVERPPDGTVRVYRDSLCKTGPQSTFASTLTGSADGKYPSLVNFPQHDENGSQIPGSTWNDQISCLTIGGGIERSR